MPKNEEIGGETKNVKIYVRILPLLKDCENCARISQDKKTIYVRCLQDMKQEKILQAKEPPYWSFVTDGIFFDCSQDRIYQETTKETIDRVLGGANCVLISCGQTGTGKSFTTGGLRNNWEHRGLVPRLVADLFCKKERSKRTNKIRYGLSYVEFSGRKFKDLLNLKNSYNPNNRDSFKSIRNVSIKSEKDALRCIFQGEGRRSLAKFSTYPFCHLGTTVITFHVNNTSLITSWAVVSEAKIHIVEMAGIDNAGKSSCLKTARDVIAANSMKLELEQYFENLGKSEKPPSPIARSSGLLKYLGDTLSLNSIIRFIAHVKVTREDLDVVLSTLRFMGKIGKLQAVKVTYSVRPQSAMFVEQLQEEIERLKKELYINEMFFGQEAIMNVSTNRAEQIRHDILDYLNGAITDLELISLSQIQILTRTMKELYMKIIEEKEDAQRNAERFENALKSATRNVSKTSVQGSAKGTSRKSSNPKDVLFMMETDVSRENENDEKVGALGDPGITLGPGIPETPAITAVRVSNFPMKSLATKTLNENHEDATDGPEVKSSDANIRKTFEKLQEMLKRLLSKPNLY